MKRALIFILFITGLSLLVPHTGFAQGNFHENTKGGRKKENGNQTSNAVSKRGHGGLFKRNKSAGNADAFASNSVRGGGGFFHKLFHGKGGSESRNASLRKTKPGKVQNREQAGLFRRHQSAKKAGNEKYLKRQKNERSKNRSRGSSFSGK
ncbi:MAG TPA: hypothetical protein VN698_09490 [Bacteroidia bacterium]|nr:hypothetical protein [Bacteroidia bacterium]